MTYCETQQRSKQSIAPASFRWITRGNVKLLIGCPRGKWRAKTQRCSVGTVAYKVLRPATGARCRKGKRITKK